jgi:hypothetical protein
MTLPTPIFHNNINALGDSWGEVKVARDFTAQRLRARGTEQSAIANDLCLSNDLSHNAVIVCAGAAGFITDPKNHLDSHAVRRCTISRTMPDPGR